MLTYYKPGTKAKRSKDAHLREERRSQLPEGSSKNEGTRRGNWHSYWGYITNWFPFMIVLRNHLNWYLQIFLRNVLWYIFWSLYRFMDLRQQWLVYANRQSNTSLLLLNYPFLGQCLLLQVFSWLVWSDCWFLVPFPTLRIGNFGELEHRML